MEARLTIVLLVCISCLASSDPNEYAELSDVLSAEEVTFVGEAPQTSYYKIPFFALKHKAKQANKAKTQSQCQQICSKSKACKSFSFSVKKRDCLWSRTALAFNGHFSFFSKRINSDSKASGMTRMSKYREFVGLMYQSRDWTAYKGQSKDSCQDLCDRAKDSWGRSCHGFSYRSIDKTCLLSPFGVHYDTNYDYFERNPTPPKPKTKTKLTKTGKLKTVKPKKNARPPLDKKLKLKKSKSKSRMTSQYKTQVSVDEGAAKWGKKELAHKLSTKKKVQYKTKKLALKIKVLAKKEAAGNNKAKKAKKKKTMETVAEERKRKKTVREKTMKKFILIRKKQQEKDRKKAHESSKKLRSQKAKMQEKLKKELNYKSKKKAIEIQKKKHKEMLRKKIDGLVKVSINLTSQEKRNKKRGYNEKEHYTKEQLVKRQVAHVKGRRHARHKRQYAKFVAATLKRNLRKRKTATSVAIAMKQTMKQRKKELANVLRREKKQRAFTHMVGLNAAKLKAKANGFKHGINMSARKGRKAPAQEVELRYTMNQLRAEQRKHAYAKQKVAKLEREVSKRRGAVKRLDNRMTEKNVGRRRRASKPQTTKKKKKKIPIKIPGKTKKPKKRLSARRRRTQARLSNRYMTDMLNAAGSGTVKLPGVPSYRPKKKPNKR